MSLPMDRRKSNLQKHRILALLTHPKWHLFQIFNHDLLEWFSNNKKNVDLCMINHVESVKISFERANDLFLLNEDGVQYVLD